MFADRLRIMKPQLIFPDPQILFHKSTIIFIPQIHNCFYSTNPQFCFFFIPQIHNYFYSTNPKCLFHKYKKSTFLMKFYIDAKYIINTKTNDRSNQNMDRVQHILFIWTWLPENGWGGSITEKVMITAITQWWPSRFFSWELCSGKLNYFSTFLLST